RGDAHGAWLRGLLRPVARVREHGDAGPAPAGAGGVPAGDHRLRGGAGEPVAGGALRDGDVGVKTIFRYVTKTYLKTFVGIFFAVLVIFLVTDFVDRAKSYTGPNWVLDVLELYAWKAVLVAQQLAPAALLLAAGAAMSVI